MLTGDPVRFSFYGSTGPSSVALPIFYPGTNTPYLLQSTDWVYIVSMLQTGADFPIVFILTTPAGTSTLNSSTVLLSFNSELAFYDGQTEAMAAPQGVIPSVLEPTGSLIAVQGSGFVVHAPGTTRPAFMNSLVPNG